MSSRFCDATTLPLLADADTGFGNVTNVARAVRLYEKAGVAGLFIEDQVFPKRCGHMAGKGVVPAAEWLAKIRAALDARPGPGGAGRGHRPRAGRRRPGGRRHLRRGAPRPR